MLDSIITELKTIGVAFNSIQEFIYNRPSAINWSNRAKKYPCILVDSQVDIDPSGQNKYNLIKSKNYKFRFFAFDEYSTSDQNNTTQESKQQALELILDQYIAEVRRRTLLDSSKGFLVGSVSAGFHAFPVHNDKLMQVSFGVELISNSSCGTGSFSYNE